MSSMVYADLDVHKKTIVAYLVCSDTGEIISGRTSGGRLGGAGLSSPGQRAGLGTGERWLCSVCIKLG